MSQVINECCPDFLLPGQVQARPEGNAPQHPLALPSSCPQERQMAPRSTPLLTSVHGQVNLSWQMALRLRTRLASSLVSSGGPAQGRAHGRCLLCPGRLADSRPAQAEQPPRKGASRWPGTCRLHGFIHKTEVCSTRSRELQSDSPRSSMTFSVWPAQCFWVLF